jgi:glutamate dehydrogenase
MQLKDALIVIHGFGNARSFLAYLMHSLAFMIRTDPIFPICLSASTTSECLRTYLWIPFQIRNCLNLNVISLCRQAISNQITGENADRIQASVIVEAANRPTTLEVTKILMDRGIPLVPDILASSGGLTVMQKLHKADERENLRSVPKLCTGIGFLSDVVVCFNNF